MKMLAFDTCLDKTYVTYTDGSKFENKVIVSNDKNYHSAYLISTIVEMLKKEGLEPKDLDCVAIDIGPGSFTGIRACTTVARMLGQQLNIKVIGVSSLEILYSKIIKSDLNSFVNDLKNKEILESHIDEYSEDYKKSLAFTLALYGINPIEEKQFENLEDEDTLKTVEQIKKNIIKNPDIYLEGIFEDPELKNCYAERATKAMHIPLCMLSKVFDKKTIDYLLRQRESNFHDFTKKFVKIPTSDIEKFKQVLDKKHSEDPKKNIKEFDLFKFSKDLYVDYNSAYRDQDLVKKTLERIMKIR